MLLITSMFPFICFMRIKGNIDVIKSINVPLYLFYADPGTLFLPGLSDWYREHAISQYKAVKFPNSTHQLIHENPERFAKAVKKILEL